MMGSKEEQAQITTEVAELLRESAIQETQLLPKSFVSQTFQVEKKDGGQRPVVNLKCLNQFMRLEYFKMDRLQLLPNLIQVGDWMTKLDLKDAYIFPGSRSPKSSEIPGVWMELQILPIQMSPILVVYSP